MDIETDVVISFVQEIHKIRASRFSARPFTEVVAYLSSPTDDVPL